MFLAHAENLPVVPQFVSITPLVHKQVYELLSKASKHVASSGQGLEAHAYAKLNGATWRESFKWTCGENRRKASRDVKK